MRRGVGLVLAGLGTCLIVFAVLMPTWVSSKVLKFPLNEYASVILTGRNATYFSPAKLTELTGVNMEATYTIKGNAAAGSSSTAVWNQFIYVYDQTNKLPFQTMTRTFAFDRRTALLINCCGSNVNGDSSIDQRGYVGYVLPIGTQQRTYDVFDTSLNKPVPFAFTGEAIVGGIDAYEFTANIPPTQNGSQTLPGSLVGQSAASVTLPQYYENHATYWIDPDTGALLNVTQNERLTLRDSSGATALVLFDAYLAATPASVNALVALDNSQRSKVSLVTRVLPLVTGILGVVLLIVGILLARRPREDLEAGRSAGSPELAAAGSEDGDSATHASLVPGLEDEPREATVESPVVKADAAQAETAQAETAQAETAQPKAAMLRAPRAKAAQAEAEAPEAEAPAAEEAAEAKAEAAQSQDAPAETPAAESQGAAESATGEDSPADTAPAEEAPPTQETPTAEEAPTAEMPASASGEAPEAAAEAPDEGPAAATRRGRRGAHRR